MPEWTLKAKRDWDRHRDRDRNWERARKVQSSRQKGLRGDCEGKAKEAWPASKQFARVISGNYPRKKGGGTKQSPPATGCVNEIKYTQRIYSII